MNCELKKVHNTSTIFHQIMLLSSLKNYFKHIRFVFLIMGVFYLALFVALYGVYVYLRGLIISETGTILSSLEGIVREIIFGTDLKELLTNGTSIFVDRLLQLLQERFDANIGDFIALVTFYLAFIALACQIGVYLCRFSIRKEISKHNAKNFVIAFLLRFIMNAIFWVVFGYLVSRFLYSVIFLVIIFFAMRSLFDMIESKVLYFGDKKFFEVVNFKNIIESIFAYFMFFVLTIGVALAIWYFTNVILAVIITIPLLLYLFESVRYTAVEFLTEGEK